MAKKRSKYAFFSYINNLIGRFLLRKAIRISTKKSDKSVNKTAALNHSVEV